MTRVRIRLVRSFILMIHIFDKIIFYRFQLLLPDYLEDRESENFCRKAGHQQCPVRSGRHVRIESLQRVGNS